jgi:hypothetical protein
MAALNFIGLGNYAGARPESIESLVADRRCKESNVTLSSPTSRSLEKDDRKSDHCSVVACAVL